MQSNRSIGRNIPQHDLPEFLIEYLQSIADLGDANSTSNYSEVFNQYLVRYGFKHGEHRRDGCVSQ